MPIIETTNPVVSSFKGLHLYHAHISNCSARVRLLLEEKKIPWESHHIFLAKRENITEEYFSINPKGVVPSLVHDGKIITESNDILIYLEKIFPDPSFRNVSSKKQLEIERWLKISGEAHMPGIKTFQYFKRNAKAMKKTEAEVALYRRLQKDPAYLAFHGKHDLPGQSFTAKDAEKAVTLMDGYFTEMEDILSQSQWLVENTYTLADISWSPTITTLKRGGYDFNDFPNLMAWYNRISMRPSFQTSVTEWHEDWAKAEADAITRT
jgi:glutathione S-transferase